MRTQWTLFLVFAIVIASMCHSTLAVDSRSLYDALFYTSYSNVTIPKPFFVYQVTSIPFSTVHNVSINGFCTGSPCQWYLLDLENYQRAVQEKSLVNVTSLIPPKLVYETNVTAFFSVPNNTSNGNNTFESIYKKVYFVASSSNSSVLSVYIVSGVTQDLSWIYIFLKFLFGSVVAIIISSLVITCIACVCCCSFAFAIYYCCFARGGKSMDQQYLLGARSYNNLDNRHNRLA
jgi:hypothetical protein